MRRGRDLLRPISAIGAAVVLTVIIVSILSDEPGRALLQLLLGPASTKLAMGETLARATRLAIAGLAAALAFRSGIFNLGGEGMALAGGLAGAAVALAIPGLPKMAAPLAAVAAASAAGAALGAVSGYLKARYNVDELISSFLIAAAVAPVGHVLLSGPMHDPGSYLIAAPPLPDTYRSASWLNPSRFGPAIIVAIAAVAVSYIFIEYTRRGYEWRLRGANEAFARYGGIATGRIALTSMTVSGAVYGLAGGVALLEGGQAVQGFTSGLGWDGLAVALIAASRPEWIFPAALAYSWVVEGTRAAQLNTGFPYALGGLVQGIIFLLVTARAVNIRVLRSRNTTRTRIRRKGAAND